MARNSCADNCLFEGKAGEVFDLRSAGLRAVHRPAPAAQHVHDSPHLLAAGRFKRWILPKADFHKKVFLTTPGDLEASPRFPRSSAYFSLYQRLPEQQEIVRRVEGLFALAAQLEGRLARARGQVDKLTPSLLARAFAGQLVPQDPSDEPASALLARMRTQ